MDEIQSQDDYPIAGDESTNDKITDLLRDSGAFDRPPVDEARLYGGPGASLESTAKAYRQNAAESRAHRSEPDLDPTLDDFDESEGSQGHSQASLPPNLTTPQGVMQAKGQLAQAVQEVQMLARNGQISQDQLQQAMLQAEHFANQINAAEIHHERDRIAQHHAINQWHGEMSQRIPEWENPANRDRIITEMRNFFGGRGIPDHVMNVVDNPDVLAAAYGLMHGRTPTQPQRDEPTPRAQETEAAAGQRSTSLTGGFLQPGSTARRNQQFAARGPLMNANLYQLAMSIADEHGIPRHIARNLINTESSWNPNAVSSAGAQGLVQLMPGTQRDMGVTNPFDPEQSLRGGFGYLKQQFDRFGDWPSAVSAYHAGPTNFAKGKIGPQTQAYMPKVMGLNPGTPIDGNDPGTDRAGSPHAGQGAPARPFANASALGNGPQSLMGLLTGGRYDEKPDPNGLPGVISGAKSDEKTEPQMPKKPSSFGKMDYSGFLNSGYTEGRSNPNYRDVSGDAQQQLTQLIGWMNNLGGGVRSRKRTI